MRTRKTILQAHWRAIGWGAVLAIRPWLANPRARYRFLKHRILLDYRCARDYTPDRPASPEFMERLRSQS